MGLLIFKERDPDDKIPLRKNEWHVGKSRLARALGRSPPASSDAVAANGRSPIRRDHLRSARRRNNNTVRVLGPTGLGIGPTYVGRARHDEPSDSAADNQPPNPTVRENTNLSIDSNGAWSGERDRPERVEDYAVSPSSIPPSAGEYHVEDERVEQRRNDQREPSFGYVLARAHARVASSRADSPERDNRWRVASPDTQRVILQQIENQSDGERYSGLYVDGARDSPDTTLHMSISRSDGLGDRRRSLSGEIDRPSDVEENWNSLMETIPTTDANLPSATSSFASDSASSILSRNRPRSSLTNTTTGSRSASALGTTSSRRLPCPESEESLDLELPSFFRFVDPHHRARSTSTRPSSIPTASLSHASTRSQSAVQNQANQSLHPNALSETRSHGLDNLDELMDMLSNGTEVPPEMWASVGISPHLGVRGLAARLRRRSERL